MTLGQSPVLRASDPPPLFVWLLLLGFAFSAFSGNAGLIGLPLSPDRPLFLLAGLLIVLDGRIDGLRWRSVYVVLTAMVAWSLWSWLGTGTIGETAKGFALLDRVLMPVVMLALGALAFPTRRSRDLLLKFLALVGIYLGSTGVFAYVGLDGLVFPRYITNDALGIQSDRGRGPFLSSEPYGMVCAVALFAALTLLARRPGRRWSTVAWMAVLVSLLGVMICLTRSVWLGALAGALVAGSANARTRRLLPIGFAAVGGFVVALLALFPALQTSATARLSASASVYDRLNTNAAAWRIIERRPMSGVGWGNFRTDAVYWVRQGDLYPISNIDIEVHNVFLSRAAELGLPGLILWLLVIITGPVAAVWLARVSTAEERNLKLLALACGFVVLVPSLTSPNPYPMPNLLVWLLAGVAGRQWLVQSRRQAPVSQDSRLVPPR